MLEDLSDHVFSALSDVAHLRLEAMRLLEQGLRSGDMADVTQFIERQIGQDPPHLLLLRELAGDVSQRLETLRAHHTDVREQVVRMLRDGYDVDIASLSPAFERPHNASLHGILERILAGSADTTHDLPLLRRVIAASFDKAAELQRKIELTGQVLGLLNDWLNGIHATTARRYGELLVENRSYPDLLH
ncbi:MAG: hypothetical protein GX613_02515 [Chloroflexi bacterium]|nr:hypothetical protein [Chloroflexota bacterium]